MAWRPRDTPAGVRRLCQAKRRHNASRTRDLCWVIAPLDPTYAFASTPPVSGRDTPVVPGNVIGSPFSERTAR